MRLPRVYGIEPPASRLVVTVPLSTVDDPSVVPALDTPLAVPLVVWLPVPALRPPACDRPGTDAAAPTGDQSWTAVVVESDVVRTGGGGGGGGGSGNEWIFIEYPGRTGDARPRYARWRTSKIRSANSRCIGKFLD
jgi:hypothetical protein